MKALGIDPGLANTGWAIVSRSSRGAFDMIDSGIIKTNGEDTEPKRMQEIYSSVVEVIHKHQLDIVAVERVFFNNNPSSCLTTAGVCYICSLAAEQLGLPTDFFTPQQVKAACGCGGKADKRTVSSFVFKLTGTKVMNWHVADAGATAIAGLLKTRAVNVYNGKE